MNYQLYSVYLHFAQVEKRRSILFLLMALWFATSHGYIASSISRRSCQQRSLSIFRHPTTTSRAVRKVGRWQLVQPQTIATTLSRTFVRLHSNRLDDDQSKGKEPQDDDEMTGLNEIMDDVEMLLADISSSSRNTGSCEENGWITMDWSEIELPQIVEEKREITRKEELRLVTGKPSPVEVVLVRDRVIYVKRDDLLRLNGSHVSGNKARKMYALNQVPVSDFPDCIVSYGGPQSNAMLALAAIVHSKNVPCDPSNVDNDNSSSDLLTNEERGKVSASTKDGKQTKKRFVYYTKKLPRFLKNQPNGNLFRAQTLGMELVELTPEEYRDLFGSETGGKSEAPPSLDPPVPGGSVWIPQGGSCGVALPGGRILAQEIFSFWYQNGGGKPLSVLVPGGTCSTALLLHRELRALHAQDNNNNNEKKMDIRVVVIPCVGDDAYARRQMKSLNMETGGTDQESELPSVLTPVPDTSYMGQSSRTKEEGRYLNFGEPDGRILDTFREMKEHGMFLDLLYGAPAWTILLRHWTSRSESSSSSSPGGGVAEEVPLAGRELMYVHSGGLEGITSQLMRYQYKGLVDINEIQLPGEG